MVLTLTYCRHLGVIYTAEGGLREGAPYGIEMCCLKSKDPTPHVITLIPKEPFHGFGIQHSQLHYNLTFLATYPIQKLIFLFPSSSSLFFFLHLLCPWTTLFDSWEEGRKQSKKDGSWEDWDQEDREPHQQAGHLLQATKWNFQESPGAHRSLWC